MAAAVLTGPWGHRRGQHVPHDDAAAADLDTGRGWPGPVHQHDSQRVHGIPR